MLNDKRVLALIPARGGSKRLPQKNILPLGEKPLITWTIEAALESDIIDSVVVSTDCKDIANVSIASGAKVPFERPEKLSNDNATSLDVVLHALDKLAEDGEHYDIVILLQPTSPLRCHKDIINAFELFDKKDANGIVSVCEMEHSPLWSNTLPADLSLSEFLSNDLHNKRSQELQNYYRLNGAIYITLIKELRNQKKFLLNENCFAFIMDKEKSVDIDTLNDFHLAEFYLKRQMDNEA
ncbi:MAG: CMP-N-acetlyneuraminic acid synthetase [Kangiella sp.]|nr:MAG: CMP-N-acetlyneuraminic acid synthetase [Kangiella sp.]